MRRAYDSFLKLNPRNMMGNPVMFVVEMGSVLTTALLFKGRAAVLVRSADHPVAVVYGSVCEFRRSHGRRPRQGAGGHTCAKPDLETMAHRLLSATVARKGASSQLASGDLVIVSAGEFIPGDGEIIEGVASVDESAITGESRPVIREAGGDRSAVTGGTRVLSDQIKVRITSNPGETFLDR